MGITDQIRQMFNPQQPQQQPQQAQQLPASNVPGQPNQNQGGAGNNPNEMQDPLNAYAELFKPADPSKKQADPPSFSLDPKIIDQAAGSMDFTASLPPELQQKLQSGDTSAFMEALNHVGRNAYKNSISHMSSLTDKFVGLRSQHDQNNLGSHVRNHLVKNTINSSFADANPVARQSLEWVSDKMREAFPDASPDWIAKQAPQFFVEMAKSLAPDQFSGQSGSQPNQNRPAGDVNWADWLTDTKVNPQSPSGGST